jgi:DUF4097 and DUF4098 domain-containing protein YvlB
VIHKTFEVDGSPDIDVRIESGRVEVRRAQAGVVDVQVDTRASDFIVEQRGNSILVSSDKNQSWLSRGSAFVIIETPDLSDLSVAVASAQIQVGVPLAKAEIKTASGDIELGAVQTLVVKTASGDTRVGHVERALRYTSASGDLYVSGVGPGSVAISTASGDVLIERCEAILDVNTASGDVQVPRFTGRSANLKAMSGTVELGLPRGTEVSLDARLLSGTLRLPDPEPTTDPAERHVEIRAKMVSGDLRIERAD